MTTDRWSSADHFFSAYEAEQLEDSFVVTS